MLLKEKDPTSLETGSINSRIDFVPSSSNRAIVFDLGGTWFRSATYDYQARMLLNYKKQPAFSYIALPRLDIPSLRERLIEYVTERTDALCRANHDACRQVAISFGGAVNATNQMVLDAAPIWGPGTDSFDLRASLAKRRPQYSWQIVNDVTATLLRHLDDLDLGSARKVALITVSTGIATRVFDQERRCIHLERHTGLQGEIGHIPVNVTFRGNSLELPCDCGGINHLNAFSSGRGMVRLIQFVCSHGRTGPKSNPFPHNVATLPEREIIEHLKEGLECGDAFCVELLDASVMPLAQQILTMLATDPLIEKIIIAGGCVEYLAPFWLNALKRHLVRMGLYQVNKLAPNFFDELIICGISDDASGLIGAALSVRQTPKPNLSRWGRSTTSWKVGASRPTTYLVRQTENLLDPRNSTLALSATKGGLRGRAVVIADNVIDQLYGDKIRAYFGQYVNQIHYHTLQGGEATKQMPAVLGVCQLIDELKLDRRAEPIVAIGGGVILDIVGFAASIYRRGTPYVRVPTTLMAYVDAGVGIKTGANVGVRKNRLGAYHAPLEALLDVSFLRTLPIRHICNGIAEIIKLAIMRNEDLFTLLERQSPQQVIDKVWTQEVGLPLFTPAIEGMLDELADNLWEENLERLMDFGHTFSPEIELSTEPHLLHGEAVAIDMALCAIIAKNRNLLSQEDAERILALLQSFHLPFFHPVCDEALLTRALASATLHRGGLQRICLPTAIGRAVFVNDLVPSELVGASAEALERQGAHV